MNSLANTFDVEQTQQQQQQHQTATTSSPHRRAFSLGVVTGGLAFAALAAIALFQAGPSGRAYRTAEVNAAQMEAGVRPWEWEHMARFHAGELNTAELGLANLKNALEDSSLMGEVAQWLHHPDGRKQFIKTMVDPQFQAEAKVAADKLKKNGALPNLFNLELYAATLPTDASNPSSILPQEPGAAFAFGLPATGKSKDHAISRPSSNSRPSDVQMNMDQLKYDAKMAFPLGYFDPLKLSEQEFWGQTNEATIGFLRHAEIKHGRVAMAGFIGYCLHENGVHFPWKVFPDQDWSKFEGLSAPAVWDALPFESRLQIIVGIGFFEVWSERSDVLEKEGEKHYMRGGKPGFYPSFKEVPHPVPLNLFDPLGASKGLSETKKAAKRYSEINNGRLAMIGFMSLVSEAKIPGSVPLLKGLIKPYTGILMKDPWGFLDNGLDFGFIAAE
jgi:hypothetical protein